MVSATLLLALAGASIAAPLADPRIPVQPDSFVVPALVNKNFKPNGPAAYRKALAKYGRPIPEALQQKTGGRQNSADGDGSVTATPDQYDVEYTCPVNIGGQTLSLDFDTGSADLWVYSTLLAKKYQTGHSVYNPAKSTTAKKASGSWSIQYGDGSSASGSVYTDTVTIGQTSVKGQVVELASKLGGSFTTDTSNDGLVGLAFSSINTVSPKQAKTFSENALPQLSSPVFAADLKHNQDGAYYFGSYPKTSAAIKWTSVDSSGGFWEYSSPKYAVGTAKAKSTGGLTAIADTGTTLLLVSEAMTAAYYAKVPSAQNDESQGGYTIDCSATLPSFTVYIGATNTVTVPGSLINFAPIEDGSSTCFGGIQSIDGSQMIFGDIFLKSIVAYFDLGQERFGFVPKSS